jgi:hypothetical protein
MKIDGEQLTLANASACVFFFFFFYKMLEKYIKNT